jgi:cell division protein FtsQ
MSRPPKVISAGPRLAARARAERQTHRQVLVRRTTWCVAVAAPLALLGWVVLASSLLAVQRVVVTGEARLTAAQVVAAAGVAPGTPLARVDTAAVARRIRALGPVAEVTVSRGWPHALQVKVVERVAVVAVPRGSGVDLLDGQGFTLATVVSIPRGVFRLDVQNPSRDDPATKAALTVLRGLPKSLRAQLASLTATSPEQVTLLLKGGRQVLWGGVGDAGAKASTLLALLKMPGTIFDVSAPGVATRR